jgi:nitronate monooxygenase
VVLEKSTVSLPTFQLRGHTLKPIVQGGMGVGISRYRLAGTVAAQGGMGTLAAQGLKHLSTLAPDSGEKRRHEDPHGVEACRIETAAARTLAGGNGLVAVNVMVAITHYAELVKAAIAGGAQAIVSGAGLPLELPAIAGDADVALIPIVSSPRALKILCRQWKEMYGRLPDAVIVEGPKAGGHLGFRKEDLDRPEFQLEALIPSILEEARRWGEFPLIAAGGVWSHEDAKAVLSLGASAVQLGTRFVMTHECDAAPGFKAVLTKTEAKDIVIVDSPVGMPARVVRSELIQRFERGEYPRFKCHYQCLHSCVAETVHYCIADHLVAAASGDEQGLFFVGANGWRCREVVSVADVMSELQG